MTTSLRIWSILVAATLCLACSTSDDGSGAGGSGGIDSSGGTGGFGGGGGGGAWGFGYCESSDPCGNGEGTCGDTPCFLAACGACECGEPDCICDTICECEPSTVGGTCVPHDFTTRCATHADEAACATDDVCRWAVAGCGDDATVAGCHPKQDCAPGWCGDGSTCTYVALEGCTGSFLCL